MIAVLLITGTLRSDAQSMLGSLTVNSHPTITLSSIADYENGTSVINQTVTINTTASMNWVLKLRASGTPERMGEQLVLNSFAVQVTNMPGAFPEIRLSMADQDIASGTSAAVMQTLPVELRYRVIGGNDLLKPAGDYTTSLTFTLTMVNL